MATRRLLVCGGAGILGGLLWAAISELRLLTQGSPVEGLTREDYGRLTPIAVLLLLIALQGVQRVHLGRAGGLVRWGYLVANAGLALLLLVLTIERWVVGEQSAPRGLFVIADLLAYVLVILGFFVLGLGTLRAGVLPLWARPLPMLIGPAFLIESFLRTMNAIDGAAWILLGVAVLLTPALEVSRSRTVSLTFSEARAAFLSRTTLISGVIAVGVWSLEWSWVVGILVVLLLYAHEIGHVLAAFWRGVAVKRAPVFLPGFGAFVETAPGASTWDEAWISLGGPIFGGACALIVKVVGIVNGIPELAHAGDFALIVNALNLAPFSPLDGGRVARTTGWLGVLLTLGLGIVLLIQGIGLFLSVLVLLAGVRAIATVRQNKSGVATHVGIFGVYLVTVTALLIALVASGQVQWLPSARPSWLPSTDSVLETVFWLYISGIVALPFAWRPGQTILVRYGIAALIGWPRYLLNRQLWMIVIAFALLGEALGLPGVEWTRRYAVRLARNGDPAAGAAAAFAFDALVGKGDAQADSWLESLRPTLVQGGVPVTVAVADTLTQLGYTTTAAAWRPRQPPTAEPTAHDEDEAIGRPGPDERSALLPSNVETFSQA